MEEIAGRSCVAWFKITEVVRRGERERVWMVVQLLGHSLDMPLLKQLEADVRLALDEAGSAALYGEAAETYIELGNHKAALTVMNHAYAQLPSLMIAQKRYGLTRQFECVHEAALSALLFYAVELVKVGQYDQVLAVLETVEGTFDRVAFGIKMLEVISRQCPSSAIDTLFPSLSTWVSGDMGAVGENRLRTYAMERGITLSS